MMHIPTNCSFCGESRRITMQGSDPTEHSEQYEFACGFIVSDNGIALRRCGSIRQPRNIDYIGGIALIATLAALLAVLFFIIFGTIS